MKAKAKKISLSSLKNSKQRVTMLKQRAKIRRGGINFR